MAHDLANVPDLPRPLLTAWHPLPDLSHPAAVRAFSDSRGIRACALSADGTTVVAAVATVSGDTLVVWDARSGTERFRLASMADQVLDCAISADSSCDESNTRCVRPERLVALLPTLIAGSPLRAQRA